MLEMKGDPSENGIYLVRDLKAGDFEIAQFHAHLYESVTDSKWFKDWVFIDSHQELEFEAAKQYIEPIVKLDLEAIAELVKEQGWKVFPDPMINRMLEEKQGRSDAN